MPSVRGMVIVKRGGAALGLAVLALLVVGGVAVLLDQVGAPGASTLGVVAFFAPFVVAAGWCARASVGEPGWQRAVWTLAGGIVVGLLALWLVLLGLAAVDAVTGSDDGGFYCC